MSINKPVHVELLLNFTASGKVEHPGETWVEGCFAVHTDGFSKKIKWFEYTTKPSHYTYQV